MPKGASLALLVLLFLTAAALSGATVFFQQRFDKINAAYQEKLASLEQVGRDLAARQAELEKVQEELELKTKREEEFSQQYTQVKGTLEQQVAQLERDKLLLSTSLDATALLLNQTNNTLALRNSQVLELETRNTELDNDLDDCEDELQECCGA
jgi:chromosome segregation ATPase